MQEKGRNMAGTFTVQQNLELPADEPTGYVLQLIADEERDHIEWAEKVIGRLIAGTKRRDEVIAFQKNLSRELQEAGGIWGGEKNRAPMFSRRHIHTASPRA